MMNRRGAMSGEATAEMIGLSPSSYYRAEMGLLAPSMPVAKAVASWLGWTLDAVVSAAEKPPTP